MHQLELDDAPGTPQVIGAAPGTLPERAAHALPHTLTFMRTARSWALILPVGARVDVNGTPVIGLKMLADGHIIDFNGHRFIFRVGALTEILTAESPEVVRKRRSPLSKLLFTPGMMIVRCPICRFAYSADDWDEITRCSNPLGCTYTKTVSITLPADESS